MEKVKEVKRKTALAAATLWTLTEIQYTAAILHECGTMDDTEELYDKINRYKLALEQSRGCNRK